MRRWYKNHFQTVKGKEDKTGNEGKNQQRGNRVRHITQVPSPNLKVKSPLTQVITGKRMKAAKQKAKARDFGCIWRNQWLS